MPIYEYRCQSCGCDFDLQRSMSERNDEASCGKCGARAERFSIPSNFYVARGVTRQEGRAEGEDGENTNTEFSRPSAMKFINGHNNYVGNCSFYGGGIAAENASVGGSHNAFINVDRAIESKNSTVELHNTLYRRKR